MIITRLNGGLGNQLFQYAMGRRAALHADLPYYIDIEKYKTCTLRKFGLKPFNIQAQIATHADNQQLHIYRKKDPIALLHAFLDKFRPLHKRRIIKEPSFRFQPDLLNIKSPVYIDGDWQSPKYFEDAGDTVRKDLELTVDLNDANQRMLQQIQNSPESLSIHIRRGDLVSDAHTNQTHGTTSLDYYDKALSELAKHLQNPIAFLFSDDHQWAQANLKTPGIKLIPVDHNPPELDFADLHLMSHCQHHIIANSTFSWWAAWLSRSENKKVYYPKAWFRAQHHDTSDLFPESWNPIS